MTDRTFILIRHAEKEGSVHLSKEGTIRAHELVGYFERYFPQLFSKIDAIYAERQHHNHTSNRAIETVKPMSQALHLPIRHDYFKQEIRQVIVDVTKHNFKVILVCWEHAMLAELSHSLGMSHRLAWGLNPYKREDKHCFDATWLIDTVQTLRRLRIYKQFKVTPRGNIEYAFPSNIEVFASVSL